MQAPALPFLRRALLRPIYGAMLLLICGLLSACAHLMSTRDVSIPLARLQENMERRFPFQHRALEMFDIRLHTPRLSLIPAENRIMANFEAVLMPPLTSKTWRGTLAISGGFRIDAARNAIFLRDARLEDFSVNGADAAYKRQISQIGSLLLERILKDMPIYTLQPEQMRLLGTDFTLAKITTQANALVVSFEPVKN